MPEATPRLNWEVYIICRECRAQFEITRPDASVQVLDNRHRMILITVSNECPKCHSLRTVETVEAVTPEPTG